MPHPLEYVVTGALMKCNQGTIPAPFTGTYNQKVKVNGIKVTTAMDLAPLVNIPSFGICAILSKSSPVPCVPAPTQWQDTYDAKVLKQETLIYKSCMNCAIGGKISFITSGQIPLPPEAQEKLDALKAEQKKIEESLATEENAVGETGIVEGMVPVWGAGRDLVHNIQTGKGWGVVMNAGFLVWDVASIVAGVFTLGGGTAAMQGVKLALKGGVKATVKYSARQLGEFALKQITQVADLAKSIVKSVDDVIKATGRVAVRACFVAGTPISTKEGLKPIEKIQVGDWVYAYNEETGETGLRQVVSTMQKEVDALVEIQLGKEKIQATPEHPFFVNGKWVEAGEVKKGYSLQTYESNPEPVLVNQSGGSAEIHDKKEAPAELVVDDVRFLLNKKKKVFNFEVEGWHTYFVGKLKVIVHNGTDDCIEAAKKFVDELLADPTKIWGKSADEIASEFQKAGYEAVVEQSTKKGTSGLAKQVRISGHPKISNIQVHPGGGRHVGEYYKISTNAGKIKVVNPSTYKGIPGEKARIIPFE